MVSNAKAQSPQDEGRHSYRCYYHPKDSRGIPQPCESGALPSIRLQARCANDAELLAAASVHGVVANVERIDDGVVSVDFEAAAEVQA